MDFASLGSKFIELLESKAGKAARGGQSGLKKITGTIKLSLNQTAANKELLYKQREIIKGEKPERVLYNGKAIYPVIWGLKNKGKAIFISPLPYMHYVKGHTHVAFNSNFGDFFNKLTFSLAYFGMITTVKISKRWLHIDEKIKRKEIQDFLLHNKSIYTISPSLFSRPDYWEDNLKVLRYHQHYNNIQWQPDKALNEFTTKHNKILFITFGSMVNPDPAGKTGIILSILERNKIPAIINTASGGLVKPANYDSGLVYFVSQIPYEWIFLKVYGIIHHGGSGTTHLALKHGCASLIVPHIIDQFVWNKIVYEKGLGPKGIKIGKISTKSLEPKILDLTNNPDYKKNAGQIKNRMEKENFKQELFRAIIV